MAQQKRKNSAFMQPVEISQDLEKVVGKGPMPRTEIIKKLWAYIKKNKCQDTKNKRMIIPDDNLAKVFKSKNPIDMFQMTKKVNEHIQGTK
jgi:chromatin remodeling complex protein RSC6